MLEMVNALTAGDWHMFRPMKEQGMSISEIARKTGVSRKTVRKYIAMEKPAKYSRDVSRKPFPPLLRVSSSILTPERLFSSMSARVFSP